MYALLFKEIQVVKIDTLYMLANDPLKLIDVI